MTLEPCPYCGGPVRYGLGVKGAICLDPTCFYEGPIDDEGAEKHNHLSRIVRAAEKLVKARKALVDAFALTDMDYPHFAVSEKARNIDFEIEQANRELTDAVEGGAER